MLFKRRHTTYIDAIEWTGDNLKDVQTFMHPQSPLDHANDQLGINAFDSAKQYGQTTKLVFLAKGGWIVRDELGRLHAFTKDEFTATFEAIAAAPVPEAPPPPAPSYARPEFDEGLVAGENYHG